MGGKNKAAAAKAHRPGAPRRTAAAAAQATAGPALVDELAAAVALLREERLAEAEPALERILQSQPNQPDALHFLGVLQHTQGRVEEAVSLIRRSLAVAPHNASAWNNLGNVLLLASRFTEAAEAYDQAVQRGDPRGAEVPRALSNLGVLYDRLGRLADSERVLRQALEREPEFADAWYHLSNAIIKQGRVHEGLLAHAKAVALWPEQMQSRQEVIRSLLLLGEHGRAATLLRDWLAAEPDNPVAMHMLAACQAAAGQAAPERASDRYVEQVFDAFAASFDAKLEGLNYRAPELVVQALREAAGEPTGSLDIVDAGCGTGLCGPGLRPFARRLAGCDLSQGMLQRAHTRQVYDQLHKAELVYYLDTQPGAFDAVVSADTLCYFGALEAALAAAHRCLRPGGWLVFTVEALPEDGAERYRLQVNGRYAHAGTYVRQALQDAGFELKAMPHVRLRMEAGESVMGWLVSARALPG